MAEATQPVVDYVDVAQAGTLAGLFAERVRRGASKVAYLGYNRASKSWQEVSWAQMQARAAQWQAAMRMEKLQAGDRVAMVLRNCTDWICFDQAAAGLGLVTVPLYVDDRPDNVAYILEDAAVKLLLVENERLWKRLSGAVGEVAQLQRIILLESASGGAPQGDARIQLAAPWLAASAATTTDFAVADINPNELASIVYTSGTTGKPKGVMLSHHNMLADAHASLQSVPVYPTDLFLSFLPLSHTFERTIGYYAAMMAGAQTAHARSVAQLAADLETIRPTAMIAVPRIFERVYAKIQQQLAAGSPIKRLLFNLTVKAGWQRFLKQQGRAESTHLLWLWPLLSRLVAAKIMAKLGGRVRCAISGGAALPPKVARTFIALGLQLQQGYGLTEFSPVASVNKAEDNEPVSVGQPLQGVEVKIGDSDELLLRGPGRMLGYWNNHSATREAIDPEGWLHTGDRAKVERGHVYIIGRIKEIIVLSNGEKLPPTDMESAITEDPLFEQVMVLGEGRAYLTAITVLETEHWVALAKSLGLDPFDKTAVRNAKVEQKLLARMKVLLKDFPGYAKIRNVTASLDAWTPENNMMTATMKLKRKIILETFADAVERMYAAKLER